MYIYNVYIQSICNIGPFTPKDPYENENKQKKDMNEKYKKTLRCTKTHTGSKNVRPHKHSNNQTNPKRLRKTQKEIFKPTKKTK